MWSDKPGSYFLTWFKNFEISTCSYMLVINSHKNYASARHHLLESLRAQNFPFSNVIVVIAGSDEEALHDYGPDREIEIFVQNNAYDLTHAYGVHRFLEHPRVQSDVYMVIHDVCIATDKFTECYENFVKRMREDALDVLYAFKSKQLGLIGLSQRFYKEHGGHYHVTIDKGIAWQAEHGGQYAYSSYVAEEKVSSMEGEVRYGIPSQVYGSDIYRHPVYVPSMGLYKFVANDGPINPPYQKRVYP